ncbi:tetratricopeptide repeat protein [Thermodesulfobacteriota bacterium]
MQRLLIQFIFCFVTLALLAPASIQAESVRSLVESGNKAYELGDYVTSLDSYNKAAEAEPDSAIVLFNKGNALYKQGEYADAFDVYEQGAVKAMGENDPILEAQSRYNMGNSSFRMAEALSQENSKRALDEFNRSGEYFQSAILLDPGLSDAVHNLEVSRMAAKQVEELIRKQQQQAQQQEKAQEQIKKDLEELSEQQNEAAEQSESAAREQQQSQGPISESDQKMDRMTENQKKITERTQTLSDKLEQLNEKSDPQLSDEMAKEHIKRAIEKQGSAQEDLEQKMPEQASADQKEAAGELEKALQQLEQGKEEEQKKGNAEQGQESSESKGQKEQQPQEKEQNEQNQEAAPQAEQAVSGESPEDIINEEMKSKKYRRSDGANGYKPVDKDW